VEARFQALRKQRAKHGLGLPIFLLSAAGAVAAITLMTSVNEVYVQDGRDDLRLRVGLGAAVVAVLGTAGAVTLARRIKQRRVYAPELRALQKRRHDLRLQLQPALAPQAAGANLVLNF